MDEEWMDGWKKLHDVLYYIRYGRVNNMALLQHKPLSKLEIPPILISSMGN
jgi:hypothetical protein